MMTTIHLAPSNELTRTVLGIVLTAQGGVRYKHDATVDVLDPLKTG